MVRLLVAGGSHPRYIRNLGTGEDQVKGAEMQSVEHTVQLGGGEGGVEVRFACYYGGVS